MKLNSRLNIKAVIRFSYSHQCRGKKKSKSKGAAEAQVRSLQKQYPDDRYESYPCTICNFWHVGHAKNKG